MTENGSDTRSNRFVAAFQIDAVCDTLRMLVPNQMDPGPEIRVILQRLRDSFVASGTGATVEAIPEVTANTSPEDLVAIAEVLRATMVAFLTPEERHERGAFGFRA